MSVKRKQAIGLTTLVILGVALYLLLNRPGPTPTQVAMTGGECLARRDAECLASLASESEMAAYGVSRIQVVALLRDYYFPRLAKLKISGTPTVFDEQVGSTEVHLQAENPNNEPVELEILAAKVGTGVRLPTLITDALLAGTSVNLPSKNDDPGAKMEAWANTAEADGPKLSKMGFTGLYRDPNEGLLSWADWSNDCRSRARAARERTAFRTR
jgi:hypothetical protein